MYILKKISDVAITNSFSSKFIILDTYFSRHFDCYVALLDFCYFVCINIEALFLKGNLFTHLQWSHHHNRINTIECYLINIVDFVGDMFEAVHEPIESFFSYSLKRLLAFFGSLSCGLKLIRRLLSFDLDIFQPSWKKMNIWMSEKIQIILPFHQVNNTLFQIWRNQLEGTEVEFNFCWRGC